MNKQLIKEKINNKKIVAIIRGIDEKEIIDTVKALIDGGVTLLEFTFDHVNTYCIEETTNKIKMTKDYFGDQVCVGAGTVLYVKEVEKAIEAGAEFIISPNVNTEVIKRTNELDKVSMPGALTPTEAVIAYEAGADYVKLFPAGELGKNYIKALMSPLKHIPFIAVGGINPDNVVGFLELGVCGFGIGGNLIDKKAIKNKEYSKITEIAQNFYKNINT